MKRLLVLACFVAATGAFAAAHADDGSGDPYPLKSGAPVSRATLDTVRGGFETPAGLRIAFGIERAVYVNGGLVATTSLNVADTGSMATGLGAGSTFALIQGGSNNAFGPGAASPGRVATVIQNSLDNQKIQGVTLVTATVNSLELTKRASIQSSIQDALTGSLRR